MNPIYEQLFNPQFVNKDYVSQMHYNYELQQQQEIAKAVKAIHDFCDAARKIDPQHQQSAVNLFIAAVFEEMGRA